jgi:hypothetical protein
MTFSKRDQANLARGYEATNQNAKKEQLIMLALHYDYVPKLPIDSTIAVVQSQSPGLWLESICQNLLEPGAKWC